ncbi:unnamed protein product [Allacma fusca]|uniref:Golgi apparatus protein 1 n=1 Tax=Allacma fusca TaxID=39272 RepID=A0A8J2P0R2_9HEXA|nr:unnamed protein product [Allacma fusca]
MRILSIFRLFFNLICVGGFLDTVLAVGDGEEGNTLTSKLVTNPKCQAQIARICGKKSEHYEDLDALECILNEKRDEADELSDECNHQMWLYRKSITESDGFLQLTTKECKDHFKHQASSCFDQKEQLETSLVDCIVGNKEHFNISRCRTLVTRLESVIFGDYELMGRFAEKCLNDITKFKCGRNEVAKKDSSSNKLPHSQGKTIECLSDKVQQLDDQCAVEILRIAELQVDDFHLDRALFFACREDREKFCARVSAGNGRVYKCLVKHKLETEMSSECREQIFRRQRLGWHDFRASGIVGTCKTEIRKYRCRRETSSTSDKHVRLSQILLCLENAAHTGHEINRECLYEIKQHRRALLEDYTLTPELLSACISEQTNYCAGKGVNGNTIHCLMALAQSRDMDMRIKPQCRAALENIIKIGDISSDWSVDPVLEQKCLPVKEKSSCATAPPNRVLDCLMNLLVSDTNQGPDANAMTEDCETTLLQIQYFISRDFPLDSVLFETCKDDAKKLCGATTAWSPDPDNYEPSRGPLIMSCLFRNIDIEGGTSQVSRPCADKVREIMRRRAISVRLMPEIEEPCLTNLADFCSEKTRPGDELNCLQDHIMELSPNCKIAVSNFTEMEMRNPTINPYLYKYCRQIIDNKCSEDKSEDSDLLQCLIELKPEMKKSDDKKCRASVEHLQLLRLKDIYFSPKFKSQCHEHVVRNCQYGDNGRRLVACLSEIIRNDTLMESTPRISKGCRKQVRNLLLSKIQLENGQLDQNSVYAVCRESVKELCPHVVPGGGRILECMSQSKNRDWLRKGDENCYKALFKIQQDVNNDGSLDIHLQRDCSTEIKLFCPGRTDDLVSCLLKASNQVDKGFNAERCGRTLRMRQIEQNSDARLNPRLRKACRSDISRFCPNVQYGEGRVLKCLKKVYVSPPKSMALSPTCKEHITGVMEGAAQRDVRIDNALYVACKEDIDRSCQGIDPGFEDGDGGKIEECLKSLFHNRTLKFVSCQEQVKQMIQSTLIDIHVDPILNKACSLDLIKRCDGVPPGDGRLIGCLLAVLEDDKVKKTSRLSRECHDLLLLRTELFQQAGSSKLESIQDIVHEVQKSPHKNYFLTVAMTIVGLIFIFGLFCGRATRRRAEFKDK